MKGHVGLQDSFVFGADTKCPLAPIRGIAQADRVSAPPLARDAVLVGESPSAALVSGS